MAPYWVCSVSRGSCQFIACVQLDPFTVLSEKNNNGVPERSFLALCIGKKKSAGLVDVCSATVIRRFYARCQPRLITTRYSYRFCSVNSNTMLAQQVSELEKRASALEAKLGGGSSGASDAATLARLNEIKAAILQDRAQAELVVAERDELKKENEELKEKVARLNYRVMHLLRALDEKDGAK